MTTTKSTKPRTKLGKSMKRDARKARGGLGRRLWRKILRGVVTGVRDVRAEVDATRKPRMTGSHGGDGKGMPGGPLGQAQRLQGGAKTRGGAGGGQKHAQPPDETRDWDAMDRQDPWGGLEPPERETEQETDDGFEVDDQGWPITPDDAGDLDDAAELDAGGGDAA